MQLQYPLIVHNEFLTHRMLSRSGGGYLEFSRNASSNRAITSSRIIQQVLDDPYIPTFMYTTKGMVGWSKLPESEQEAAVKEWLRCRDEAVKSVLALEKMKVHKQWRNRLLMPFQWITVVATANYELWGGFVELRHHPDAQPDIAALAHMINKQIKHSKPQVKDLYDWHLPYITKEEDDIHISDKKVISVARCARVSHLLQGTGRSLEDDVALYRRLVEASPPHASPFEHVAQVAENAKTRSGNFRGFYQLRKMLGL